MSQTTSYEVIMVEAAPVSKDKSHQNLVPTAWRGTIFEIVEAFKGGDFTLSTGMVGVRPISAEGAVGISNAIQDYGDQLVSLPEETWQTSVCQWTGSHWEVMVDLYMLEEGSSDLILHVRVYEDGSSYTFNVHFVYVP